jgi:ABC-type uncharacterized transport system fused permease/ATPase subunit
MNQIDNSDNHLEREIEKEVLSELQFLFSLLKAIMLISFAWILFAFIFDIMRLI